MHGISPNQSRGLSRLPITLTPLESAVEAQLFEALRTLDHPISEPREVYPWLLRQIAADQEHAAKSMMDLLTIGR